MTALEWMAVEAQQPCVCCGCRPGQRCVLDMGENGHGALCAVFEQDEGVFACSCCTGDAQRVVPDVILY